MAATRWSSTIAALEAVAASVAKGAKRASDLADVCAQLDSPRAVWVMVPSGAPTQQTIDELLAHLQPGDILIDGGNSNFRDSMRRAEAAQAKGIEFIDAGTSGGVWGLKVGYCLMVGAIGSGIRHVRADLPDAGAGERLCPHGTAGIRTLRQDGPQRHRIRDAAGVRGRL